VRQFDVAAAKRVDHFIANSRFVQERIQKCYQRESTVIYPPVEVDAFDPQQPSEDFYLLISALTPYKRVDIAVEAFNRMGKTLIVIGDGPELDQLRAQAKPHVRFLGTQPFAVLKAHYERCRAFIFPQLEDFGITAVEAQAAGKPVLAYRAGGVLDSVVEGETGLFFDEQTPESLIAGVEQLERTSFSPERCRRQAEKFRAKVFREQLRAQLRIWYPTMF
jgi:glycosyltransferase involved in cell wall biosynthesis